MKRVLIANRGEIALRAVRACRALGLETVAVHSAADGNSPHVWAADRAVCIGPAPPKQSYLNASALIAAALACGCDAVYPGYGFLSEKSAFASSCEEAGLVFVGPSAATIALMGNKVAARRTAAAHGIPVVPGSECGFVDAEAAESAATVIGFPLLLKASGGGGGRGMRIAEAPDTFRGLFEAAAAEAQAAFGQPEIYLERFFPQVKHIEIQVFGDDHGNHIALGERDCSVQRRHQKLVEEAPSPVLGEATRRAMSEAAVALIAGVGYVNAGTIEFIYDEGEQRFYFIEMNTRIQVEHPVTEMLTGTDLVREQFRVAAGQALSVGRACVNGGAAIEFRINAEDPANGFSPSPGRLERWRPPSGPGIRFDSHAYEGYAVPPFYDSLLGKLIVTGTTRDDAIKTAIFALETFEVSGVATTIPFHLDLLRRPEFAQGRIHTRWVEHR